MVRRYNKKVNLFFNGEKIVGVALFRMVLTKVLVKKGPDYINRLIGKPGNYVTRNKDELKLSGKVYLEKAIERIGDTGFYYRFKHNNDVIFNFIKELCPSIDVTMDIVDVDNNVSVDTVVSVDNNVVNGYHNHHILPRSAFPEFADLNKYIWNCISLPIDRHNAYHKLNGGTYTSSNGFTNWVGTLNEFCKANNIDFDVDGFMVSYNKAVANIKRDLEYRFLRFDIQKPDLV
jgi:hypothetical protein